MVACLGVDEPARALDSGRGAIRGWEPRASLFRQAVPGPPRGLGVSDAARASAWGCRCSPPLRSGPRRIRVPRRLLLEAPHLVEPAGAGLHPVEGVPHRLSVGAGPPDSLPIGGRHVDADALEAGPPVRRDPGEPRLPRGDAVIGPDRPPAALRGQQGNGDAQVRAAKRRCINRQHAVPRRGPPRVVVQRHPGIDQAPPAAHADGQHRGDPVKTSAPQSRQRRLLGGRTPSLPGPSPDEAHLGYPVARHTPIANRRPGHRNRHIASPRVRHHPGGGCHADASACRRTPDTLSATDFGPAPSTPGRFPALRGPVLAPTPTA